MFGKQRVNSYGCLNTHNWIDKPCLIGENYVIVLRM